ncbi:MAG: YciI family protein [Caulobacterales bacterium]
MQYLLLIYSAESDDANQDGQKIMADYGAFTQGIVASGAFKSADRLKPVADATTVRVRDGKTLTTDGPFAETREQLGGYYLVEAKNLDEATAIAAKVPTAKYGSIEVRPVWAM